MIHRYGLAVVGSPRIANASNDAAGSPGVPNMSNDAAGSLASDDDSDDTNAHSKRHRCMPTL
jgi:hypothetical protein